MKLAKRLVSALLVLVMLCSLLVTTGSAATFKDIEGHWAQKYIEEWIAKGVINGYPDGTFRPNQYVTRAEVSKILALAYEMPTEVETTNFSDVAAGRWFYSYIQSCAAFGVIDGYPDGSFRPDNNVTRSEAVKMVCLAAGLSLEESGYEVYSDAAAMPTWAAGYWNALIKVGVINGDPAGTLRPNDLITRAEMIKILCFAVDVVEIYELQVSITDNLGNVVSDKASYLTGDAFVVNTLVPLLIANRENFAAVYPSGDMRDLLDAGVALAKEGYADGWTEEELAAWNQYLVDGFSTVGGEKSLIELLSDVTTTIAVVARDTDHIMTFFDTEEGRTDIEYTVTIRVEVMD